MAGHQKYNTNEASVDELEQIPGVARGRPDALYSIRRVHPVREIHAARRLFEAHD